MNADWLWPLLGGFGLGVLATLGFLGWLILRIVDKATKAQNESIDKAHRFAANMMGRVPTDEVKP